MTKIMVYMNAEINALEYQQAYPNQYCMKNIEVPEAVDIFHFEGSPDDSYRLMSDTEVLNANARHQGISVYHIIDDSELPDSYFRKSWEHDNQGNVTVNMEKAVVEHIDNLRIMRAPELSALDVKFQRALETGDNLIIASVVARKSALRDVTKNPAIASATTPDQLKIAGLNVINGD